MGALALFLAISGGSAYALAGHNTVRSDDIVNKQVKKGDLADASVTTRTFDAAAVAPDAAKLGGSDSSAYQRRVYGGCANGRSIAAIDAGGAATCSSPVSDINVVLNDGGYKFLPQFPNGPVRVVVACKDPGTQFRIENAGGEDGTLNWMFSQGNPQSNAATVNASGNSIAAGDGQGFFFTGDGTRLEGQWIFANSAGITTVNLHAYDGVNFCEFRGTAVYAPSS
jgi:hypothetical protein